MVKKTYRCNECFRKCRIILTPVEGENFRPHCCPYNTLGYDASSKGWVEVSQKKKEKR